MKESQHNVATVYFGVETVFLSNILFRLVSDHRKHSRQTRKPVHTVEIIPYVNVKIKDLYSATLYFPSDGGTYEENQFI